jgi:hypothetical protein
MRNVAAQRCGHMAGSAVHLVGVMLRTEVLTMTIKTFRPVESDSLFRFHRAMWIVATGA